MFQSFVDSFMNTVVNPSIHSRMMEGLEEDEAAAKAVAPVDTGNLVSMISGHYDQATKTATLYADAPYSVFQELGYRLRNGRAVPGKHFMQAGLAAMGRPWGARIDVQFATAAPKYHARTIKFTGGKIGRAKLILGHKRPAKP